MKPFVELKNHKFLLLGGLLILFAIPLTIYATLNAREPKSRAAGTNSTINVNGTPYYLLGVNYPWGRYASDFAASGGVSSGSHYVNGSPSVTFDSEFSDMKTKGVHVLRWNVFEGSNGINYDSTGTPTGLMTNVLSDIQAAVAVAKKYNIYLNLVLTDFSFFNSTNKHTDVFTNPAKTTAFMNTVATPILNTFPNEPNILSWEIMNEPEWGISDLPQPSVNTSLIPVTMSQFWNFGSQFSNLVHSKTKSMVTVGSATLKFNKVWTNSFATKKGLPLLNLDYYQTHFYGWMDCCSTNNDPDLGTTTWSPLTQNALSLGLDKPIVVGEIPVDTAASGNTDAACGTNCFDKVFNNGYAGIWPWSYENKNTSDHITVDWSKFTPWEAANATLVRIGAPSSYTYPTPYSYPTPLTDTTPPTISITTPTNSSTVTGIVAVTGTASDNVGLSKIQLIIDDLTVINASVVTSPFTINWNSASVGNGIHKLAAKATDTSGNPTTNSISVTVNNTTGCVSNCQTGSYTAEYFNNQTLTGIPIVTRSENKINNDWSYNSPVAGIGTDHFSVRWTGNFIFEATKYRFNTNTDDGIRVYIDGLLLGFTSDGTNTINSWKNQPATTYNALKTMTAGSHKVVVEFYENAGQAVAKFNFMKFNSCYDMDADSLITNNDLVIAADHLNLFNPNLPWDVNGDKAVNSLDLAKIASKLGISCP